MSSGEQVSAALQAFNSGKTVWSGGANPVRVLVRWVHAGSGSRHRWAVHWLSSSISPGQKLVKPLVLKAPAGPGTYRLIISLLRVTGGKTTPPPSGNGWSVWPGEFGRAAVTINVR